MPTDALPQPWPMPVGAATFRRVYRDALGRPMRGRITLTGTQRTDYGDTSILPAPVTVELVDGVAAADLPPDTYTWTADLRTAEGARVTDSGQITL